MALEGLDTIRRVPIIYDPDMIRAREEAIRVRMEYRVAAREYLESLRTGGNKKNKR